MTTARSQPDTIPSVAHTVRVHGKPAAVCAHWNRVEEYPSFIEGVREIGWLDDRRFKLISEAGGLVVAISFIFPRAAV